MARWARLRFALLWVYWVFVVSLCRAGWRIVGLPDCRIAGLPDCRIVGLSVVGLLGECIDQEGHKSPTTPAPTLKKICTGRIKYKHGFWCLGREEHERVSRGGA